MNKIKQHRPAYFSGFENAEVNFETKADLLNIEFVKNFAGSSDFYRFSLSTDRPHLLMAEIDNGFKWWVVGYLDNVEGLEFPKWEPKYELKDD